jgi:hypothetical protein
MNDSNVFVGIDYHKRYSVISAVDASGRHTPALTPFYRFFLPFAKSATIGRDRSQLLEKLGFLVRFGKTAGQRQGPRSRRHSRR